MCSAWHGVRISLTDPNAFCLVATMMFTVMLGKEIYPMPAIDLATNPEPQLSGS